MVKEDPRRRETALPVGPAHTSGLATKTALSTRAVAKRGPTRPIVLINVSESDGEVSIDDFPDTEESEVERGIDVCVCVERKVGHTGDAAR